MNLTSEGPGAAPPATEAHNAITYEYNYKFVDAALEYARCGFRVVPLKPHGKTPLIAAWPRDATTDERTICTWWRRWPDANIGLVTGEAFFAVDVDNKNDADGRAALQALIEQHGGEWPAHAPTSSTPHGTHYLLQHISGIKNSVGKLGPGLDIRGEGGYIVAPPSRTPDGQYEWLERGAFPPPPAWLTGLILTPRPVKGVPDYLLGLSAIGDFSCEGEGADYWFGDLSKAEKVETLRSLLSALSPDSVSSRGDWQAVGSALRGTAREGDIDDDAAFALWEQWSISTPEGSAKWQGGEKERQQWVTFKGSGVGALISRARAAGWQRLSPHTLRDSKPGAPTQSVQRETERSFSPTSDVANAMRLRDCLRSQLMFVRGVGWFTWSPPWKRDELGARRLAASLGRIIASEVTEISDQAAHAADPGERDRLNKLAGERIRWARASEAGARIAEALNLAEPLLAVEPRILDANPYLLGCINGVVDLQSGELREHRQTDYVTKNSGHAYDPNASAPMWNDFLNRIMNNFPDMIAFLQCVSGYWLTGKTDPHKVAICHGRGANGKSTFFNALRAAMGDYAIAAPPGLLLARRGEHHPTELADLRGARLVVAAESGEGGALNEELVKMLSGGDTLKARYMHRDFFQFDPTHKLALMTNHRPTIRGTDEGIWRRLWLVPFDVSIPEEERDPLLGEKLRGELPGILAWAVAGCLRYQREGIGEPGKVVAATATYRSESDVLAQFFDDRCEEDPSATILGKALYDAYTEWCGVTSERPYPHKSFAQRVRERGIGSKKINVGIQWVGLRLRLG